MKHPNKATKLSNDFAREADLAVRALLKSAILVCQQGLETYEHHQVPLNVKKALGRIVKSVFEMENTIHAFSLRERERATARAEKEKQEYSPDASSPAPTEGAWIESAIDMPELRGEP